MRKVTFYIDDIEYFRKIYNLTEQQAREIFNGQESFRVIYTIYGNGKDADRSIITDYDGNKVDRNLLNGYQRGVVLNDCMAYFIGGSYWNNEKEPCGVVKIEEGEGEYEC